jgi:hypothetical protein
VIIVNGKVIDDGGDDVTGDVGVVITGVTGPIHMGKGNQYNNVVIMEGDVPDGIHQTFGGKKRKKK